MEGSFVMIVASWIYAVLQGILLQEYGNQHGLVGKNWYQAV